MITLILLGVITLILLIKANYINNIWLKRLAIIFIYFFFVILSSAALNAFYQAMIPSEEKEVMADISKSKICIYDPNSTVFSKFMRWLIDWLYFSPIQKGWPNNITIIVLWFFSSLIFYFLYSVTSAASPKPEDLLKQQESEPEK